MMRGLKVADRLARCRRAGRFLNRVLLSQIALQKGRLPIKYNGIG
jgi:hypothetical protein